MIVKMSENIDDDDECTIEEEEQERLMLVELPPKKSKQGKIIDGVDDTGGQTSGCLHLRSALCLLWTIVQFLMALVGVYHLSSLIISNRSRGQTYMNNKPR
jgi:hypothetical protein